MINMEWIINLEELEQVSLEELKRAKMVLDSELIERTKSKIENNDDEIEFESFFKHELCAEPLVKDGLLYAYGAKKKSSSTNHSCKFVSINDQWVWESPKIVKNRTRYSDSEAKLITLAVITIDDGDKVDVIESRANLIGHKAKKITSYLVKNGQLEKTKSRVVRIEPKSGF
jgi:hypothetical protein